MKTLCQYPKCNEGLPNLASYFIETPDSYAHPTRYFKTFYCSVCVLNYPHGYVGTIFMPISLLATIEAADFDWPTELEGE